jgi:hypothetical protein
VNEVEFQRGVREAQADIANGTRRIFWQTRSFWGERFTNLMRDRFNVEVVHISDMTSERQRSYESGYNKTVESHVDAMFGAGAFVGTWNEVQEYRQETYRRHLGSQDTA